MKSQILANGEKPIALEHVGDLVEPPLDRSSIWRYVLKGVKVDGSAVKLDSVKIGGKRYTSLEAWQRFIAAQNPDQAKPAPATNRQRQRQQSDASKRLAAAGLLSQPRKKRGRPDGGHQSRPGPPVPAREPADAI